MSEIFKALCGFSSEVPIIQKNKSVSFGMGKAKYNYADLPSILSVVKPLLAKHGLSFFQTTEKVDGETMMRTVLVHLSGDTIESFVPVNLVGLDKMQVVGANITYARRYGLQCILGLSTEDDTDCSHESGGQSSPGQTKTRDASKVSVQEIGEMVFPLGRNKGTKIKNVDESDLKGFLSWCDDNNVKGVAKHFSDLVHKYLSE